MTTRPRTSSEKADQIALLAALEVFAKKRAMASQNWDDPRWFFDSVLGAQTYDKQIAIAESVMVNRRTAVVAANGTGKDWLTGRFLLFWLNYWHHKGEAANVIVIGPTNRQVEDVVFRESRIAFRGSKTQLPGRMYDTPRYEIDESHYAIGFSTDRSYNLQGFHSPHGLIIMTEAHAIPQTHIESAKRITPERIVMTGNPLSQSGELWDAFHGDREGYETIQISAFDTPNLQQNEVVIPGMVTAQDVEDAKRDYGEDSPLYIAGVLGQFPDNTEDAIIPLSAVMAAVNRQLQSDPNESGVLGVDVARFGDDRSVIYYRRGGVCRKLWNVTGKDTMRTVGQIALFVSENKEIETVVVDDDGVGGGVVDRLRELRREGKLGSVRIIPFKNGGKAEKNETFFNASAEAWWRMREAFLAGVVDIEEDKAFIAQAVTRQYFVHSDRRLRLQSKDEMKRDLGRSPDDADALAVTFSPLVHADRLRNRKVIPAPLMF